MARKTTSKKPAPPLRKRKFVVWLRNHTSKDDDDSVTIWAKTSQEAEANVKYDRTRFSIRAVLTAAEARKSYYG